MRRLLAWATVTGTALWGFTAIQGSPVHATTPAANGRIAFTADLGLGGQVYTIKPSGRGMQQLTQIDGSAQTPEWSPDGSQIAFTDEDHGGVYVMNADGNDLHEVNTSGGQAAWTPDGDPPGLRVRGLRGRRRGLPDERRRLGCARRAPVDEPVPR